MDYLLRARQRLLNSRVCAASLTAVRPPWRIWCHRRIFADLGQFLLGGGDIRAMIELLLGFQPIVHIPAGLASPLLPELVRKSGDFLGRRFVTFDFFVHNL